MGIHIVYDVPGDGFCGIYSILSHYRELKFIQQVSYFEAKDQMRALRKMFLRPLIKDFFDVYLSTTLKDMPNMSEWGPDTALYLPNGVALSNASIADLVALKRFLDDGTCPPGLGNVVLSLIANYVGVPVTFTTREFLVDQQKKKGDDNYIVWTPPLPGASVGHFRPAFRAAENFDRTIEQNLSAMCSAKPVGAWTGYKLNDSVIRGLLAGKEEPLEYTPSVPPKTGNPPSNSVENKPIVPPKTEPVPVDKSKTQVIDEKSKTPALRDLFTGITAEGKATYDCLYYGRGPKFNEFVGSHPINHKPSERYDHPFLRCVSNWFLLFAYELAHRTERRILDIASKYHHTVNWLSRTKKQCLLARPTVSALDVAYNARYAGVKSKSSNVVIDRSDHYYFQGQSLDLSNDFLVLHDVGYYPQIFDTLAKSTGQVRGMCNMIVYPHKVGKGTFYDGEGFYEVDRHGFVKSSPAGNPSPYTHPLQRQKHGEAFSILRSDGSWLLFTPSKEVEIGPDVFFVAYDINTDGSSFGVPPLGDPIKFPQPDTRVLNLATPTFQRVTRTMDSGKTNYSNKVYRITEENVQFTVDKQLYDLLAPHVRPKDLLEKPHLHSYYYIASQSAKGRYSYRQVAYHVLAAYQDALEAENLANCFLNHPANQKITDLHFDGITPAYIFLRCLILNGMGFLSGALLLSILRGCQNGFYWTVVLTLPILLLAYAVTTLLLLLVSREYAMPSYSSGPSDYITGWLSKTNDFFAGSKIRESHYDPMLGDRMYMPFGNAYATVKKKFIALACSCKKSYQTVVDVCKKNITHFGSCKKNLEASIWTRQFNAACFPEVKRATDFVSFIRNDLAEFVANLPDYIRRAKIDFSWEAFLADSAPAKRKVYARAREDFLNRPRWEPKLSFFSKTNEVHHDGNPRPRNIACFDEITTAFGAYTARIFIKLLKMHNPGIVSGCNLEELGDKISTANTIGDINLPNWYMADGSGWDSHQHHYLLEEVDRPYARAMLDAIAPFLDIPLYALPKLADTLLSRNLTATTALGDKIQVNATVLSGNPWSTTPFNSQRNSLAQQYVMALCGVKGIPFVSGDDSLCFTDRQIDQETYWRVFSKASIRKYGIGLYMKDFKMGYLHEMNFLSKNFVTLRNKVEAYRSSSKVAVSGVASRSISRQLTIPQYCRMQLLQLADLPKRLSAAYMRFAEKAASVLKPSLLEALKFDWSYKLYLHVRRLEFDDFYYTMHPPTEDIFRGGAKPSAPSHPRRKTIYRRWHSLRRTAVNNNRRMADIAKWARRNRIPISSPPSEIDPDSERFRKIVRREMAYVVLGELGPNDLKKRLTLLRGLRGGPLRTTGTRFQSWFKRTLSETPQNIWDADSSAFSGDPNNPS